MKKITKYLLQGILLFLIIFVFLFLIIGGTIAWTINPVEWDFDLRIPVVVTSAIVSIIVVLALMTRQR